MLGLPGCAAPRRRLVEVEGFSFSPAQLAGLDRDAAATFDVLSNAVKSVKDHKDVEDYTRVELFVRLCQELDELDHLRCVALLSAALTRLAGVTS